jgi:RNA polymerase sigma-70 factor (ECF subfamily)
VIVLREVDGMAYEEIAKVLGCSVGTVMSRLHYARGKLKESLKAHREG